MKKKITILVALILTLTSLWAQDTLSLSRAIQIALENNYSISVSRLDAQIASINNSWGTVGKLPSVDISGTSMIKLDSSNTTLTFPSPIPSSDTSSSKTTSTLSAGLSANWVLFNGFSANISKAKLGLVEELSENNIELLIESTIQSVILAYNQVLLEKHKRELFEEVFNLSADRYEYEKLKKQLGNATTFNLLQAQNSYLEDKTNVLLQEVAEKNAMRSLELLLATKDSIYYILTDSLQPEKTGYNLNNLHSKMLSDNKNLQIQYINLQMLEKDIMLSKAAYSPQIILSAGADVYANNINNQRSPDLAISGYDYYANATLKFNLYGGGKRSRASKIAKIEKEISEIQKTELEHSLSNALYTLYEMYELRKELLGVAQENLDAASLNMQIAEEKYKSGSISSFNYRDIQLIYERSALNYYNAVYNTISSELELKRIVGDLLVKSN